jgi:hypothetical protein
MSTAFPDPHLVDFRHAPPSRWTCIGQPDDPWKTLVREDGALLMDYLQSEFSDRIVGSFQTEIAFKLPCADAPEHIEQENDDPANAIVVTCIRYSHATLVLHAFGHRDAGDRRSDVVLWEITAHPSEGTFAAGLMVAPVYHSFRSPPRRETGGVDVLRPEALKPRNHPGASRPIVLSLSAESQRRSGSPMEWCNFAAAYHLPPTGMISRMAPLGPGQTLRGAVVVPMNHSETESLTYGWAVRALRSERARWRNIRRSLRIPEVPDAGIQGMLESSARNILQARESRKGLPEFQVGPTCYRNLWVVDAYYLLQAARFLGLDEDAERGTQALLRRARPDGAICEIPHHTMETAISMATLVRQAELSPSNDDNRKQWPLIMKAVGYLESLRRRAKELDPSHPAAGLLPPAYPDGGIGGERAEFLTPLWTLAGLNRVRKSAQLLELHQDLKRIEELFHSLKQDFLTHAERDLTQLPEGTPYLRMWRGKQSDHITLPDHKGTLMPWETLGLTSGTWAFCQAIYTGELFPPEHPLVQNLCALFEQTDGEQGLPRGMGWLTDRSVWPYGGAFAAQVWLYAGRPEKAVDYLYAFANHAAPTRVWREEQSLDSTGHGHSNGVMPHNWASAEFIHLVRNLMVVERGEELHLMSGVPEEWLRPGAELKLDRTPTRFGPVTLRAEISEEGTVTLRIRQDTAWRLRPERCTVHLPERTHFRSLRLEGKPLKIPRDGKLELPEKGFLKIHFRLRKS